MKIKSLPMLIGAIALSLSLTNFVRGAEGSLYFHDDYNAALESSRKVGKPLICIFSASWCGPCKQMKKSVYPSAEVQPYHDSFVWAYLDADQSKNRPLMTKFGVNGIPHISFVRPDGSAIGHFAGAVAPTQFANILDQVKIDAKKTASNNSTQRSSNGSGSRGSGRR